MFFRVILFIRGFVLDTIAVSYMTDDEKDEDEDRSLDRYTIHLQPARYQSRHPNGG
jgi:hypothetical protein